MFNYSRRLTSPILVGDVVVGGENPIRIQSMTNTSTLDTESSIEQCIRIIEAGADYVRLTAQGIREAQNLKEIKEGLLHRGYKTPLVADIHFNSKVAELAAKNVDKVRINPGNYASLSNKSLKEQLAAADYASEIDEIRQRLNPLIAICKEHKTSLRIGVNHGSLSERILIRYGDTPEGMVESCMEFLELLREQDFTNVVISMKASNTSVMVRSVRLLVKRMGECNMNFPLHLGVTEAGDGEDGRIKSAVGIGTLLSEGIGDTIRVSLSEDPELELPVAQLLVDHILEKKDHHPIIASASTRYNSLSPERRTTHPIGRIGGSQVPVVVSDRSQNGDCVLSPDFIPDFIYLGSIINVEILENQSYIVDNTLYAAQFAEKSNIFPLFGVAEKDEWKTSEAKVKFLKLQYLDLQDEALLSDLKKDKLTVIILYTSHVNGQGEQKAFIHTLMNKEIDIPVIIQRTYKESRLESLQIKAASDCGSLFLDLLPDGLFLCNESLNLQSIDACSFGILQASGRRISKTEYISCPSCGRTLFDLQTTIKAIKAATSHLVGLKIGIMGCIVNGPGEMADADYGYVGAGKGRVSLYKGKVCMEKYIPTDEAVERLLILIKKHGDWKEIEVKE
ncbi:4-hydroxy-3-methylbut-2-en-1-yl diphosphate synthase (flavodoxin) [Bacteroidales bacterium]|nr:4-hydroxy-3-methylbut-2-en-1-yl diphosphate synthase (flavodoxin) [Bacteroidales bacterium]